jgi:hypothetical protein
VYVQCTKTPFAAPARPGPLRVASSGWRIPLTMTWSVASPDAPYVLDPSRPQELPSPGRPGLPSRPSDRRDPKALRTPRQALTTVAAPFRYRVALDADGWPMIPGRYGRLQWHDETALTVFTGLWAIPGGRRWQVGDREVRGVVPGEGLTEVAGLFQARKRRVLTSEAVRKRSGLRTVRVTSAL